MKLHGVMLFLFILSECSRKRTIAYSLVDYGAYEVDDDSPFPAPDYAFRQQFSADEGGRAFSQIGQPKPYRERAGVEINGDAAASLTDFTFRGQTAVVEASWEDTFAKLPSPGCPLPLEALHQLPRDTSAHHYAAGVRDFLDDAFGISPNNNVDYLTTDFNATAVAASSSSSYSSVRSCSENSDAQDQVSACVCERHHRDRPVITFHPSSLAWLAKYRIDCD
eukprot:GHVU01054029.1.p1 GENE.GHVU01054029.1~~GHVU01054029.1.p1  ORF type:complete len:222 (+),score=17.08 GHVU01054029.1:390-1055(+)